MSDSNATQQQQQKTDAKKSSSSSSSSSAKVIKVIKAEAVLTELEIGRMVDLGLGRGVDATAPKPWINKSSFQVRQVTMDNVIGTEEGGSLQSYEREVTSVHTQQTDLKSSIVIPQAPVSIGVDAEQSRSFSTTRRAVGKKVINRTISFRADFEDAPQSRTTDPKAARMEASASYITARAVNIEADKLVGDAQSGLTFEERLSTWIMERVNTRQELKAIRLASETHPVPPLQRARSDPIAELAAIIQQGEEEDRREIVRDCNDFVHHFRITHYVSAVELGAAEYRVLSQQEYYSKVGATGSLGLEALASFAVSESASWKKTKKASDLKRIGLITGDGKVVRGTYDEAVVGISIQPISNLVKLRYLQLALRKSLLNYVEEQGDQSSGPFLISCGDNNIFLSVNADAGYAVVGTRNIQNASLFYIIPNDDGSNPYEFSIAYFGDNGHAVRHRTSTLTPVSKHVIEPVARYLDATVGPVGTNSGPLHLKYHLRESHSRLTLHSRLVRKSPPIDTAAWITGREMFFINCARRRLKKDGYICMKLVRRQGQPRYITACVPTKREHNDTNVFMLFRLLPPSHRENQSLRVDDTDVDNQLDEYEGREVPDKDARPTEVHVADRILSLGDKVRRLEPSPPGKRRVNTSGGTIPPAREAVALPELSTHPVSDPTMVTMTTDTNL